MYCKIVFNDDNRNDIETGWIIILTFETVVRECTRNFNHKLYISLALMNGLMQNYTALHYIHVVFKHYLNNTKIWIRKLGKNCYIIGYTLYIAINKCNFRKFNLFCCPILYSGTPNIPTRSKQYWQNLQISLGVYFGNC